MKFAYLGSGSRGNAALIESADATVLLDCGFAARELFRRCAARNVSPREIDAVVVTHEHSDHVKATGLAALCAQSGAAVFATLGTARALGWAGDGDGPGWRRIFPGRGFSVGGLRFSPAPILHDAAEPVQFVVENGGGRAGFLTDIGAESEAVRAEFSDLDALALECNFDETRLAANPHYPAHVKRRIRGDLGHFSNAAAAALLSRIAGRRLKRVVAAHLSENNNTPQLAASALRAALPRKIEITVATQEDGCDWIAVRPGG